MHLIEFLSSGAWWRLVHEPVFRVKSCGWMIDPLVSRAVEPMLWPVHTYWLGVIAVAKTAVMKTIVQKGIVGAGGEACGFWNERSLGHQQMTTGDDKEQVWE